MEESDAGFALQLLTTIAIQNRNRILKIWILIHDHLRGLLLPSSSLASSLPTSSIGTSSLPLSTSLPASGERSRFERGSGENVPFLVSKAVSCLFMLCASLADIPHIQSDLLRSLLCIMRMPESYRVQLHVISFASLFFLFSCSFFFLPTPHIS